jgi:HEAT repeat protein
MGKYAHAMASSGLGLPDGCTPAAAIPRILELSRDDDPKVRRLAAKNLCACHVRSDHPEIWDRVFELLDDPDPGVRSDAIHALGDGSPRYLADRIAAELDERRNDPDRDVRRRVRKVLQAYRRTGRVNVL